MLVKLGGTRPWVHSLMTWEVKDTESCTWHKALVEGLRVRHTSPPLGTFKIQKNIKMALESLPFLYEKTLAISVKLAYVS